MNPYTEHLLLFAGEGGLNVPLTPGLDTNELEERTMLSWGAAELMCRALAFYLCDMEDRGVHLAFGFESTVAFAATRMRMREVDVRHLLLIGRRLAAFSYLDEAFASERLGWSKLSLLAPIVTAMTERAWVDLALQITPEELEAEIARLGEGEFPLRDLQPGRRPSAN